ncbi:SURF1 family cytochrome oxidase biogenesis protein, partial [Roseomonas gilardii]
METEPGGHDPDGAGEGWRRHSPARLFLLGVLALLAFAGLVALGTWQVERRAWKLDLIQRVESRVHAPPTA